MEAANVHPLHSAIDENGEVKPDLPATLPACWRRITELVDEQTTLVKKHIAACGQITRLTNELEGKRLAEIEASQIMDILVNWRDTLGKDPAKVQLVAGGKRWERIRARLHDKIEGRGPWTADELKLVPVGALESEWHNGSNPKTQGKRYLEVETIYRDAEQVEKFVRLAREKWDRDFDDRLRAFHESYPSAVFEAIERERQVSELARLDPTVFLPESGEVAAEVVRYEGRT